MDAPAHTDISTLASGVDERTRFLQMVKSHALFVQGTGGQRALVEGLTVHDLVLRDAVLKNALVRTPEPIEWEESKVAPEAVVAEDEVGKGLTAH